jgi:hypothetical protein
MTQIKVFAAEIKDGLEQAVASCNTVAYCSAPVFYKHSTLDKSSPLHSNEEFIRKLIATNLDQKDLFYLESILVSTGWNKNDDVFVPANVWAARSTPEDKQFNLMHEENDIIGHITGSYVLDQSGQAVDFSTENPPEHFDIITQAVIYNSWTNPENKERISKIISEIQEGDKWYVSMECLFAGFDYALLDSAGNGKILARSEESAFLTKHLRAYGGSGEFEGYKIGRALSNIIFTGKGLVSKPANPRSIILSSKATATFKDNISNFSLIGERSMTIENSALEKQLADIKSELTLAKEENKAIKAKIEEAKDKEFASKIKSFEDELSQKTSTIAELEESIKATKARIAELEDALAQSAESLTVAMKEMDDMKKKEKNSKRKAALVEAGFEDAEAEEALAKFDAVSDDSFEFLVTAMKKKAKWQEEKKDEKKEEKKEEANVSEAFEKVETSEASLVQTEQPTTTEVETARASVASWIENNVLIKRKK